MRKYNVDSMVMGTHGYTTLGFLHRRIWEVKKFDCVIFTPTSKELERCIRMKVNTRYLLEKWEHGKESHCQSAITFKKQLSDWLKWEKIGKRMIWRLKNEKTYRSVVVESSYDRMCLHLLLLRRLLGYVLTTRHAFRQHALHIQNLCIKLIDYQSVTEFEHKKLALKTEDNKAVQSPKLLLPSKLHKVRFLAPQMIKSTENLHYKSINLFTKGKHMGCQTKHSEINESCQISNSKLSI